MGPGVPVFFESVAANHLSLGLQARTALADTPGSRFTQDSEAALAEGRFGDLLNLLVPHFGVLFQKTSGTGMAWITETVIYTTCQTTLKCLLVCAADLECCINVISHLVPRLPPHQVRSAAKQVADALTVTVSSAAKHAHCCICCSYRDSKPTRLFSVSWSACLITPSMQVDEQAQQRLQGLTELYNVADDAKTQHMLLRQAIAYATKANLANLLGPVIKVQQHIAVRFACYLGIVSKVVRYLSLLPDSTNALVCIGMLVVSIFIEGHHFIRAGPGC